MRSLLRSLPAISSMAMRPFTDARTVRKPHLFEGFMCAENEEYLATLMESYAKDKTSIDAGWEPIMKNITSASPDEALIQTFVRPTSSFAKVEAQTSKQAIIDNLKLSWLIRSYEISGHLICSLDPLGMYDADLDPSIPPELTPGYFGFTDADMNKVFHLSLGANFGGLFTEGDQAITLGQLLQTLRKTYCGKVGYEFMHLGFHQRRIWFRGEILKAQAQLPCEDQKNILEDVIAAQGFERFLHAKFSTHKRFGLDGAESLIPIMKSVIELGADRGVDHFIIGMPHRGRLNVLVNVCGKSLTKIFHEFEGRTEQVDNDQFSGDVKYHLGLTKTVTTRSGKNVTISLASNPSHLEAVNPIVMGRTRAKQHYTKDVEKKKIVAILLHGDAAFSGQGVCYESMGLCGLENFNIGGTVHIVVNNQIGFTTNPNQSRGSPYCSDLGKVTAAPIFHVNGDSPEDCVKAARIAMNYRLSFCKDVVIDLVCYRRFGHNETDEPLFTQPLMYRKISTHPSLLDKYSTQLLESGAFTQEQIDTMKAEFDGKMRDSFAKAPMDKSSKEDWIENPTDRYVSPLMINSVRSTAIEAEKLKNLGALIVKYPETFKPNPTVAKVIANRGRMYSEGKNIDWGAAEALAFATLLLEGVHVRVSGQDVERGTFSQRHAVLHDSVTGTQYTPLENLHEMQAHCSIHNSSLSEFGVCGYEIGYAMENPASLVIWEAQFGDFANGAQIMFDQFLSSGETKWIRQCGVVISLPHGYDGQGPEHSSGRIERFLQMSDSLDFVPKSFNPVADEEALHIVRERRILRTNWQVCYPTTPANYFHLLRRQVCRDFRKPLIVFFSKQFLRAPNVSSIEDFGLGTRFYPLLDDDKVTTPVRRIVLMTGQLYHTLNQHRMKNNLPADVALVRLEQLCPMPWEDLFFCLKKHIDANPNVEIAWAQEEPKNMGAWTFVRTRMEDLLSTKLQNERTVRYIGRGAHSSPATGLKFVHDLELASIIRDVFA